MQHTLDNSLSPTAKASLTLPWQTDFGYFMCRKYTRLLQEPWCQSTPRDSLCCNLQAFNSQPGKGPNLWFPTSDGTGVAHAHTLPGPRQGLFSDRFLALEWIHLTAQHILAPFGLQLQGEVWYQGMLAQTSKCSLLQAVFDQLIGNSMLLSAGRESLDSGRFYADATGTVARQTIKLCPGMIGAVACDNIALLEVQPLEALKTKDGFGRTAAMLAALFNSWAALQHLLKTPDAVDWSETQSSQASMPLLTRSSCPLLTLIPLYTSLEEIVEVQCVICTACAGWQHWQDPNALLV